MKKVKMLLIGLVLALPLASMANFNFKSQANNLISHCESMADWADDRRCRIGRGADVEFLCLKAGVGQLIATENRISKKADEIANGGKPYCVRASSDPDGDGYGWENNKSCVVRNSVADKAKNDKKMSRKLVRLQMQCNRGASSDRFNAGCYYRGLENLAL